MTGTGNVYVCNYITVQVRTYLLGFRAGSGNAFMMPIVSSRLGASLVNHSRCLQFVCDHIVLRH